MVCKRASVPAISLESKAQRPLHFGKRVLRLLPRALAAREGRFVRERELRVKLF